MKFLRSFVSVVCISVLSLGIFSGVSLSANCISLYDIEPLAEDIYFLELINRARANPDGEAQLYNIDLNEGVPTSSTINSYPKQPLAFNLTLYKAALAHSEDMLAKDYFSHYTFQTNDSPQDRAVAQGYNYYSGENIAINMSTGSLGITQDNAAYHHELLFVDENYPNRGHRVNMLASSHAEAGVAFSYGDYERYPNAVDSTSDFGRGEFPAYICGVIYDDKNGNAFYDVGEGIPHTTLTVIETGQIVEAFSAGAYSLGISSPGTFTVEAYLCEFNTYATKTVVVGNDNVKLDFLLSDFGTGSTDNGSCKALTIAELLTPVTSEDFARIPLKVSSVTHPTFAISTPFISMDISFPCYTEAVDLYIAVLAPDQNLYFVKGDGNLTSSEFAPMSMQTTVAKNMSLEFNTQKGDYTIFWAAVPANGGDLLAVDWSGYSELGFLMHRID
ncbi:MAG: CAP domain-containing protein [Desulfamplus sp.]|nr:CAP domain-containing protein [Desulfamplus sp.]